MKKKHILTGILLALFFVLAVLVTSFLMARSGVFSGKNTEEINEDTAEIQEDTAEIQEDTEETQEDTAEIQEEDVPEETDENKSTEEEKKDINSEDSEDNEDVQQTQGINAAPSDDLFEADTETQFAAFYGIWCFASKNRDEAGKRADDLIAKGFDGHVFSTGEWGSLNEEVWYVVTAGVYETEEAAKADLNAVHEAGYADAYIKYSGSSIYVE